MRELLTDICIIDDDAISVFGLKRGLKKLYPSKDLDPVVFENGLDALEDFEQRRRDGQKLPTIIFIDLNMPVLGGWEFMDEFSNSHPSKETWPEIFIMSSSINPDDHEKARFYGLEGHYLTKPVNKETLEKVLPKAGRP
ncbi:response regulator [Pseudozobellia thermophila]|uniref:Response regulator receiver domain-containing protein n=1 Tax=Pseudozobellia thermophila TaxID=192903 RepID=A0A1M6AT66_9FLAO|nr:response regulator [Pseudozobellia thermophila]SHI39621.1 Response regulator receiver domain-containing protein [Pseudozobellia thermophila]